MIWLTSWTASPTQTNSQQGVFVAFGLLRCPDFSAVRPKNLCRGEWPGRSTFGEWELGIGCNTAKCDVARRRSIADELGGSTEAPKQLRKTEEERVLTQKNEKGNKKKKEEE